MSSVEGAVVTTVAVRGPPSSNAISPKKEPAPRRTERGSSFTSIAFRDTVYQVLLGSENGTADFVKLSRAIFRSEQHLIDGIARAKSFNTARSACGSMTIPRQPRS